VFDILLCLLLTIIVQQPHVWVAASKGFVQIARILLEAKAVNEMKEPEHVSSLYMAVQSGNAEMVELLLAQDSSTEYVDDSPVPNLFLAASMGAKRAVELLVQAKANVNQAEAKNEQTPLWAATHRRDVTMIKYLLSQKADVNLADKPQPWPTAPLHVACRVGDEAVARLLVDAHADVKSNISPQTPMMCAMASKNAALVDYLRSRGAPDVEINQVVHTEQAPTTPAQQSQQQALVFQQQQQMMVMLKHLLTLDQASLSAYLTSLPAAARDQMVAMLNFVRQQQVQLGAVSK